MRVAIIGATGNVGTALLKRLATEDADVVGVARRRPPDTAPYSAASWHEVDIAWVTAEDRLVEIFDDVDAVVHLAIGFQPMRDREYLRRTNVNGTAAVARAAVRAGVSRLVHMSSSAVYSPGAYGLPVTESFSRNGISRSTYSMDKAAAEDELDKLDDNISIARLRPGLIGQFAFGSALLRYALPDLVPSFLADKVPVLPMDRSIVLPAVATSDVAEAIVAALTTDHRGAFNLAAPTPIRYRDFEKAFDAHAVPVPRSVMRSAVALSFAGRMQSVHPGWVDLAYKTPFLDTARARDELGWEVTLDGPAVLAETVAGVRSTAAGSSAPLRKRTMADRLAAVVRRGSISRRRLP